MARRGCRAVVVGDAGLSQVPRKAEAGATGFCASPGRDVILRAVGVKRDIRPFEGRSNSILLAWSLAATARVAKRWWSAGQSETPRGVGSRQKAYPSQQVFLISSGRRGRNKERTLMPRRTSFPAPDRVSATLPTAVSAYVAGARWVPLARAAATTAAALKARAHAFECAHCHRPSVTAGTIMRKQVPLTVWFWAAYLMATHSRHPALQCGGSRPRVLQDGLAVVRQAQDGRTRPQSIGRLADQFERTPRRRTGTYRSSCSWVPWSRAARPRAIGWPPACMPSSRPAGRHHQGRLAGTSGRRSSAPASGRSNGAAWIHRVFEPQAMGARSTTLPAQELGSYLDAVPQPPPPAPRRFSLPAGISVRTPPVRSG